MYIHRMATKLQEMIESLPFGRWTNAQEERLKFLLHSPCFSMKYRESRKKATGQIHFLI